MSAQRVPLPPQPFPFPYHRSPVPGHSFNHYPLLPTARLVTASIGDFEMGQSDLRVRFARHSLTDIIVPVFRAVQTLHDPSYASPNNSGTIAA
jgi:hypothetical protein